MQLLHYSTVLEKKSTKKGKQGSCTKAISGIGGCPDRETIHLSHEFCILLNEQPPRRYNLLPAWAPPVKRKKGHGLSAGLIAIALLSGCHQASDSDVGGTLRRGLGGEPSTLDPGAAADTFSTGILVDLYEGLTTESSTGDVVPGVASSWTMDPSGTEYTFQLRPDAKWSNGKRIAAQDFVTAWRREVDPKTGSPAADDLRLVAHATSILAGKERPEALGVFAPTDSTLVVKLERPAAYFPQILAHPGTYPIYSEATAKTHKPDQWISNGAYVLAGWQPNTAIALTANPHYWDRAHVHISRVQYLFKPDEASQYAGYRAGELDLTDTVPANALPTLRKEHSAELIIAPTLTTVYYGINLANKTLAPVGLRQALAMAIDRKYLVESLGFGQVGAYGFVAPGTANYTPQSWDWKNVSDADRIATAKRLYAEAGFSAATPLRLRVLFNNNEVIRRTAILIGAMWKEVLGVEVELTSEEYKVFLQSRHDTSRWDVARLAWSADFNDAVNFLDLLRAHSPGNDMSYANLSFDSALDRAANTVDYQQRRVELQQAERLMLNDYPIIPLYFVVSKCLVKPYVHGVQPNPLNHVPSKDLTLDR